MIRLSLGRQFVGTVTWRTENSPPAAGQPPDRAIRADINIPDRNMQVSLVIRRNTDPGLTASHTVSIMFTLPPDFPNGGISEIRGMLMKQAEDTRGTSLAGLAVKVTPTFFLVGLSSASDADVQRNMQLLKERSWFDIAIVYNNGRRAILAVEKGAPGERAFADAFGLGAVISARDSVLQLKKNPARWRAGLCAGSAGAADGCSIAAMPVFTAFCTFSKARTSI